MSKLNRAYEILRNKKAFYEKKKSETMDQYYQEVDDERSEQIYRNYEYYCALNHGIEIALFTIESIIKEG